MIVPVDSPSVVKLVDIQFALLDDVVVADDGTGKWTHETRISAQKCEKSSGTLNDIPGCRNHAEYGDEQGTLLRINIKHMPLLLEDLTLKMLMYFG